MHVHKCLFIIHLLRPLNPVGKKIPVVKYSSYIAKYKEYLNVQKEISMNSMFTCIYLCV